MNATPSNVEPTVASQGKRARLSRADFLSVVGKSLLVLCGLLGLGGLVEYLRFQPDPAPPSEFDLGSDSDYPPGSRTEIPQAQAVLLHEESGFSALSLICPHLGCTVRLEAEGYACPCHGSRFNLDGSLQNGPASQPMEALEVEETADGNLILHT
jgi:cytochrome b6-f complex iron-sulfur subunit